jgi:hypothetical protein
LICGAWLLLIDGASALSFYGAALLLLYGALQVVALPFSQLYLSERGVQGF